MAKMKNIILKAHAKLNLNLHLIPEFTDMKYYPVRFINSELGIFDLVKISKINKKKINISLSGDQNLNSDILMISNEHNLAYRAAKTIINMFDMDYGVHIDITKSIPIKAGLGGGSCDAAAVINGMDRLFALKLSPIQKVKIAEKLGMDICYCVIGGLCLIEGVGNKIVPFPYIIPEINNVLLVLPGEKKPSTGWAYSKIERSDIGKNLNKLKDLLRGILFKDMELICNSIWNDFENPISKYFPTVKKIINHMKQNGACASTLAGSGLTVFGIFNDSNEMLKAEKQFKNMGYSCIRTSII